MMINFGIITVSDRSSRGERPDLAGPALKELLLSQGWNVKRQEIVPDVLEKIKELLIDYVIQNEKKYIYTEPLRHLIIRNIGGDERTINSTFNMLRELKIINEVEVNKWQINLN